MRTSLRVMLTVSATVFATVAAAAYSQDTMKNPHDPLKPGREPAEDGGIAVRSGKRLHGSGHEIDDNIMQPGKQFHKPGRDTRSSAVECPDFCLLIMSATTCRARVLDIQSPSCRSCTSRSAPSVCAR